MVVSKTPNSYKNGRKWGCIGCSIQVCEGRLYIIESTNLSISVQKDKILSFSCKFWGFCTRYFLNDVKMKKMLYRGPQKWSSNYIRGV